MYGEVLQITILKASNGFSVNINRPSTAPPGMPFDPQEMMDKLVQAKNRAMGEDWKDLQDEAPLLKNVPRPMNEILVFSSFDDMVEQLRQEFE